MTYPQSALALEDLPLIIINNDEWISFQEHDQEVLKLRGKGKVGTAPSPVIPLEDARLELSIIYTTVGRSSK